MLFAWLQFEQWGLDWRQWQCHLNALTWPEIVRQYALAAGWGPKLACQTEKQNAPLQVTPPLLLLPDA